MVKALHCVIPTIGNCYLRKNTAGNVSTFSVMVHYNLGYFKPLGLYFLQNCAPSAPPDVPCQFAPLPLLVLCANQQILSDE